MSGDNPLMPSLSYVVPDTKRKLNDEQLIDFRNAIEIGYALPGNCKPSAVSSLQAKYIDDALSIVEECQKLCTAIDSCSELSFWSALGRDNVDARQFRNADTIEVEDSVIAERLWQRIKGVLDLRPIRVSFDNSYNKDEELELDGEKDMEGLWIPVGMNQDFLFASYPSGGGFAPHTDGRATHHFNRRSFYSALVYLNTLEEGQGGGTAFYSSDAKDHLTKQPTIVGDAQSLEERWSAAASYALGPPVRPVAGRVLIFHQSLVHEGVPPVYPHRKYIIRSDIMYERVPALFTSPRDDEAFRVVQEAELLAEKGAVAESILLFKKALRLSPELMHFIGHG